MIKIRFHRYTEMSCFSVRGQVGANEWKMLHLGFDLIFKSLEEMLVINLGSAEISSTLLHEIIEYKKKIPKLTKQKIFIISKEKGLGDFVKFDLFLSRFQGSKIRQIGDHIILDDQISVLEQDIHTINEQIKVLGFDESTSKKEIQKNSMAKAQQKSLEGCIKWQKKRKNDTKAVVSEIEDLDAKIKATIEELVKSLGKEVDL